MLMLHVQPGAKRTEVAGIHGDGANARLKIRLAAPPVAGKANAELLRLVAVRIRRSAASGAVCCAGNRRDRKPCASRGRRCARIATGA